MPARDVVLSILADGLFHSGQELAQVIGVSRSAVWKQVQKLVADHGLNINAVRGRGYRLAAPLELLDEVRIRAEISVNGLALLDALNVLSTTDSTNNRASGELPVDIGRARVWLAEHQTAGRGRRGRTWVSAFGENLYLSLAWRFDLPLAELSGLSLAAGVVVAEVLQRLGLDGHVLKWPNDIMVDGRKLSGVLIDVSGEAGGPAAAVIGVGINIKMRATQAALIDQPWSDLTQSSQASISRNKLAGLLVDHLIHACRLFGERRLEPFLARWDRFDKLRGERVLLVCGDQNIEGVYCGIASTGAMVLESADGRSEHNAGEVSLRTVGRQ